MRRALLVVVAIVACHPDRRELERAPIARDASVAADAAPSAWGLACKAALDQSRVGLVALEPKLARMFVEIEARIDHDRVTAAAYPPIVDVAPLFVHVWPSDAADLPWQTYATYELGGDHRMAHRIANHVDVTIGLDGWEPPVANAVIAQLEAAAAPCFGPPPCPILPTGFSFRPSEGPHHRDDVVTFVPPYTARVERRGQSCEIQLSACGHDNTWTADDVIARLLDADVTAALARHAVFGDVAGHDAFVLIHGGDTLTIGAPCTSPGCSAPSAAVADMMKVLGEVYAWRMNAEGCPGL